MVFYFLEASPQPKRGGRGGNLIFLRKGGGEKVGREMAGLRAWKGGGEKRGGEEGGEEGGGE